MRSSCRAIDHVGEWRVHLASDTIEGLFTGAARALARECGEPTGPRQPHVAVTIEAPDYVGLMVTWMNELLWLSESHGLAFDRASIQCVSDQRLVALISGRRVAEWRSSVKAATYHGAVVERVGDRWHAVILLDV